MQADRLTLIRRHLYMHGPTGVHDLARAVETSLATIRRDLQRLEEQGLVLRTHGGAEIAGSLGAEVGFESREHHNLGAKRAIADQAFERIRPHSAIFLDSGTTVLQVARRLRLDPVPLTVFTNSLAIVDALVGCDPIELVLLAGRVRQANRSVVGALAEQVIEGLWFDQLYLGASAVQSDNAIATLDSDEARLNASMLRRSTEKYLLADSAKFGRHATFRVAAIDHVTTVYTDDALDEAWVTHLEQLGVATRRART
jgi:DeoR family transcriptional regulator, aga operon transcriptional repressor